jgi:ribosome recycling factor
MAQQDAHEEKMKKTLASLSGEFSSIRAGRANPAILDRVRVDYYGAPTPISQMASVSVFEARTLVIQPWDMTALKNIEKAINTSDLGVNPMNDGKVIRIAFPPLTEERRTELSKTAHKCAEEAKVAVRAIRRDAIEENKALEKKHQMTEDDLKDAEEDIQKMTDKYCKEIDEMLEKKKKEIMEV